MDEQAKQRVLQYVSRGLKPPGVAFSQAVILRDFSVLFRIRMKTDDEIYGWLDTDNGLFHLDAWDWLAMGGVQILAHERDIKSVEVYE